ncbi:MAG: hypothetical protein IJH63_04505 [Methanobrevibacter sp.]|nr:hypothetical protein [Methanobrevibacter sp.]
MFVNVEKIDKPSLKGMAILKLDSVKVLIDPDSDSYLEYNSIQVFANHWRFIEKSKDLLKPKVIEFIKSYIFINNIDPNEIESINFDDYNEWCEITIYTSKDDYTVKLDKELIDFNLIDEMKDYTLEELGIK